MGRVKYTEEQRNEAKVLYEEKGPHAASREVDIPVGTISAWAHDYGWHTVATEKTQEATKAAQSRAAALRAELANELLATAATLIERIDEEGITSTLTGETYYAKPAAKDVKDLATAIGILIDKARLELGEATQRTETIGVEKLVERAEQRAERLRLVQSA